MQPPGLARRYRVSTLALGLLASFAALADSAPSTLPSVQVQERDGPPPTMPEDRWRAAVVLACWATRTSWTR